jgi:hypothetical protein
MVKFAKRVLNVAKQKRNALVIGSGFGYIEQLSNNLKTVFVIDNTNRELRRKNIIYKDDFTGVSSLSEIDFVFIDYNQSGNLEKLHTVLTNNRVVIFIEGEIVWPVKEYKYLRSLGYSHIDTNKGMQTWTPT